MHLIAPVFLAWALSATSASTPASQVQTAPPGQVQTPPPDAADATQDQADEDTADARLNPAQPDFTIVGLPTTLRMPRYKSAFRVTHRFARPLGSGDFGDLLNDFFGFDAGAQIGLEYRFGIARGTQIGIHRTSDKTIELFGQYDVLRQGEDRGFGLAALVALEGINNLRDNYAPTVAVLLSREFGRSGAVYLEPMFVGNVNPGADEHQHAPGEEDEHPTEDYTVLIGLGGRWRVRPTVYLVGEFAPRVSGYDFGVHQASFGVELRAGGHAFQINFSNNLGTTPVQIARGGFSNDNWYIGFNISRKFF